MKKKLAALLCFVLCVTAFTGCSSAERAYLDTGFAFLEKGGARMEQDVRVSVDFDEMKDMLEDTCRITGETSELLPALKGIKGEKDLNVSLVTEIDAREKGVPAMKMAMDVKADGTRYDFGDFIMKDGGLYVTTQTILGTYTLLKDLSEDCDSYIFSAAYEKDLKRILAKHDMICLFSADGMAKGAAKGFDELYDAVEKYYELLFGGTDAGIVVKTDGGFRIKISGKNAADLFGKLTGAVGKNTAGLMDKTSDYLKELADLSPVKVEIKGNAFDALKNQRGGVFAAFDEMNRFTSYLKGGSGVSVILKGMEYEANVKVKNDEIYADQLLTLDHKGREVLRMASSGLAEQASVRVSAKGRSISLKEFMEDVAKLNRKHGKADGITVTWGWEVTNKKGKMTRIYTEVSRIEDDEEVPVLILEGRSYLPLRVVGESLGEEIIWNSAERKAYVKRDGKLIPMNSILDGGRSFVGLRDFKKLGYSVSYDSSLKCAKVMAQ